jgi:Holliday junction resolvase RusA-like endonuclease
VIVTFFVPGIPTPGGSKRAFAFIGKDGRAHSNMKDDAKRNADWRASVAHEASPYFIAPLAGPIAFCMHFLFPRPKGHFGRGKNAAILKPSAQKFHTTKPDATKLVRSTEDALKGIAWIDDSQVAAQRVGKDYGVKPGAWIVIWEPLIDDAPTEFTFADLNPFAHRSPIVAPALPGEWQEALPLLARGLGRTSP